MRFINYADWSKIVIDKFLKVQHIVLENLRLVNLPLWNICNVNIFKYAIMMV